MPTGCSVGDFCQPQEGAETAWVNQFQIPQYFRKSWMFCDCSSRQLSNERVLVASTHSREKKRPQLWKAEAGDSTNEAPRLGRNRHAPISRSFELRSIVRWRFFLPTPEPGRAQTDRRPRQLPTLRRRIYSNESRRAIRWPCVGLFLPRPCYLSVHAVRAPSSHT